MMVVMHSDLQKVGRLTVCAKSQLPYQSAKRRSAYRLASSRLPAALRSSAAGRLSPPGDPWPPSAMSEGPASEAQWEGWSAKRGRSPEESYCQAEEGEPPPGRRRRATARPKEEGAVARPKDGIRGRTATCPEGVMQERMAVWPSSLSYWTDIRRWAEIS